MSRPRKRNFRQSKLTNSAETLKLRCIQQGPRGLVAARIVAIVRKYNEAVHRIPNALGASRSHESNIS